MRLEEPISRRLPLARMIPGPWHPPSSQAAGGRATPRTVSPNLDCHVLGGRGADEEGRGDGDEVVLALVAGGWLADDERGAVGPGPEGEAARQPPMLAQHWRGVAGGCDQVP